MPGSLLLENVVNTFGKLSKIEANDILSACIALDRIRVEPVKEGISIVIDTDEVMSITSAGIAAYYTCINVLISNGDDADTAANVCSHVLLLAVIALGCRPGMTPEIVGNAIARILENTDKVIDETLSVGFDMTKTLPCAVIEKAYQDIPTVKPLIKAGCKGGGNVDLVKELSRRLSWIVEDLD